MGVKTTWGIANFISLGNAACGTLSVFQSFSHHLQSAGVWMLAAVVFDFLDGKTARALGQATLFGKGLDCLSDVISFGVAPAVFAVSLETAPSGLFQGLLVIFVLAGAWRLSFFYQWNRPERPPGMPITANGLFFPALYLCRAPLTVFPFVFAASTLFMVLPIFLSKPEIS